MQAPFLQKSYAPPAGYAYKKYTISVRDAISTIGEMEIIVYFLCGYFKSTKIQ